MTRARILLVEDEAHIAAGLIYNLVAEGHSVSHVETGRAALQQLWEEGFSLVILDLMLPDMEGFEVCRQIRRRDSRLPILMLTARGGTEDRIRGLAAGADDYLAKPFSLDELMLRVEGMLRRSSWYRPEAGEERYRFGRNEVNLRSHTARTAHGEIALTDLEARMLRAFFRHEGEVLARRTLLETVWGISPDAETRTLDNFVVRLRRHFEPDPAHPRHFLTVRGRGYRFIRAPEGAPEPFSESSAP